ncbi:MAG: GNAT family N-acetyltransferase [Gammaproteobacteria bacterium]|nr:GNAT family N-acetyltransferase [Gammaproteobacteria bacterium]
MTTIPISQRQSIIVTERLTLRPLSLTDAPRIKELAGNPNVSKYTRSIPFPYRDGMAESWIKSTKALAASGRALSYALQLTKEKILIGSIGLIDIENSEAVLGFWIGERYWNRGYCTEATRAILEFAFNSLGLKRITAEHLTSNPASGEVMRKSGMSHIEKVRKECRIGEMGDIEVYEVMSQ